jgi:hypothetical protein
MMRRLWLAVVVALLGTSAPAHATAVYDYKIKEYVIIDHGHAPNGKLSVAAHGEGQFGSDNFHLYLMVEPAHTPIAALPSIDSRVILDSGPSAFYARWAPDSGHVAIIFRTDRHVAVMLLYGIGGGRPHQMDGPTLFGAVTKGAAESTDDYELRTSVPDIAWLSPTTFQLTERRLFNSSTPELARQLGAFGRQEAKPHETTTGDNSVKYDWYFVDFSAQAVGEIVSGARYRVKELKPGSFEPAK